MKKITLCADDYGYSPSISAAIRCLIQQHRLSCTSAMVLTAYWKEEGEKLLSEVGSPCVGLHFDLITGGRSLRSWMLRSALGGIDQQQISDALKYQLDAFVAVMGELPSYVDSHQHVHAFPHVRDAFLQTLSEYQSEHRIAVRDVQQLVSEGDTSLKSKVIKAFSKGFNPLKYGIPSNPQFAGVYSFAEKANFPQLMQKWLEIAEPDTLIMVHPGQGEAEPGDEIHHARLSEFAFLSSEEFGELLEVNGVIL